MSCTNYEWGQNSELLGPLGIDYVYLHQCTFTQFGGIFFYLLIVFWVVFLMMTLSSTASNYFSPTLGSITDKLQLSYDIAGVTFLALGNGAPDFFSLITSFSGGADELVGVGALLGGSVFVTTIVVGTIAVLCPCDVSEDTFKRDVTFHLLATMAVTVVAIVRDINIFGAFCFLLLYVVYVLTVTQCHKWVKLECCRGFGLVSNTTGSRQFSGDDGIPLNRITSAGESLQTAFWFVDSSSTSSGNSGNTQTSAATQPHIASSLSSGAAKVGEYSVGSIGGVRNGGGYTFLILDEDEEDEEEETAVHEADRGVDNQPSEGRRSIGAGKDDTINLSGVNMFNFDRLIEDYCVPPSNQHQVAGVPIYGAPSRFADVDEGNVGGDDEESDGACCEEEDADGGSLGTSLLMSRRPSQKGPSASPKNRNNTNGRRRFMSLFYWKDWSLRNRFRKPIIPSNWRTLEWWEKGMVICEVPVTLLRDLTIPTLEEDNWSKLYAMIHPVADSLLAAFVFGDLAESSTGSSNLSVVALCVLISAVPTFGIFLFTFRNKPPSTRLFGTLWALVAFAMCIVWIYMLAGELVSCLSALGVILRTPPAFLGLTVLAWGNSIGDFFTNTAVARKGQGEMAIAGCYGGPVFNILVGLGATLLMSTSQSYPHSFSVALDASSIVSIVFLFFTLGSTLAIVAIRQYRIEKWFGYYLWAVYAVYSLFQILLAFL